MSNEESIFSNSIVEESSRAQTPVFARGSAGYQENPHFGHPVI